jgi:hypothetical protein
MIRTDQHADDVRHHQPDEADPASEATTAAVSSEVIVIRMNWKRPTLMPSEAAVSSPAASALSRRPCRISQGC